ncbi:hypothetical protein [Mucisphaera calidilacus]|uniref:PEP-CTERM protein-sorting domain-containing protein n=1 Tax=Mucisphaera calidilacus TaxID=2527982 RepID=A0A518BUV6_9BACT|nr:hypothetical protein [Mucisphaera calidilacus]QDU70741.1 hypothetical protein Pan265_05760 [Mucisphaera calidilacus]
MTTRTITTMAALSTFMLASAASANLALLNFDDGTTGPFYNAGGFTSSGIGDPKPVLSVADDTAGLGSGNALFVESKGAGSELYALLDNPVSLNDLGDKIVIQLDWRLDTTTSSQPDSSSADFRFGIFNDDDNSIGQVFGQKPVFDEFGDPVFEGEDQLFEDAIFGQTGGDFDGANGPIDPDFGIHVRTAFNKNVADPNTPDALTDVRVRTESWFDLGGILSGSGNTIVTGNDLEEGGTNWGALRDGSANTIKLTLELTNETLPDQTEPEDAYRATLEVTNALGTSVFSNRDPISQLEFSTFHYMVFEDANDDFDYVIDNLSVTAIPAGSGLTGDFNSDGVVDAADVDLLAEAIRTGSSDPQFDLDGQNGVDNGDLTEMVTVVLGTNFGDANLDLSVDLLDLSALASNFNAVAGWAGGNFNTDTVVDLLDLSALASNFETAAAPEPAAAGLLAIGALALIRRR